MPSEATNEFSHNQSDLLSNTASNLNSDASPKTDASDRVVVASHSNDLNEPTIQKVSSENPLLHQESLPSEYTKVSAPLNWEEHVIEAISQLEKKTTLPNATATQQVQQKLLQIVAGRSDDATIPLSNTLPHEQRYWA